MKKSVGITTLIVTAVFMGLCSSNLTAEAARWHNGTPKVLRGGWKCVKNLPESTMSSYYIIHKTKVVNNAAPFPANQIVKVKYRYAHGKYNIRGSYSGYYGPTKKLETWSFSYKHHYLMADTSYYKRIPLSKVPPLF